MTLHQSSPASDAIVRRIASLSPAGTLLTPTFLGQLEEATRELIALFKEQGKLEENPAALALNRTVDLHREAAQACLAGKRVLLTGGLGCVGSRLIPLLTELGAVQIVIVDIAVPDESDSGRPNAFQDDKLPQLLFKVDVRHADALGEVFARVRPDIVFHLASIREPGRAEAVVREAIETNVFGTRNVINACLQHGVKDAIYSSTGKCFAYLSDHVYTGSKKLAEAQWVAAGRRHPVTRFRFTRFTHIMENGVIAQDIADGIANGLVGLHGPDRNFNIQNLRQACHLLVNALALADQTPADGFWAAVDLGWPVNTLELALYKIYRSEKPVAIHFLGVPKGYDEVFFRGQFSWSGETEYHPLINALEAPDGFGDSTGTMVGARVQPFSEQALANELDTLESALADTSLDVVEVKSALNAAGLGMARAMFAKADLSRLIDILWWGAAPAWAGKNAVEAARFQKVIDLLADNITDRLKRDSSTLDDQTRQMLLDVAETLAQVEALSGRAERIRNLVEPVSEPQVALTAAHQ